MYCNYKCKAARRDKHSQIKPNLNKNINLTFLYPLWTLVDKRCIQRISRLSLFVYKIPYRRARAWREQWYFVYNLVVFLRRYALCIFMSIYKMQAAFARR